MIAPILAALALLAIGFVPMQALRNRRAAMIAGLVGLLIIPAAIYGFGYAGAGAGPNAIYLLVYMVWVCIVGYGMLTGSVTRYVVLGRPPMTSTQRWGLVAGAYIVFAIIGWVGYSQVMASVS